MRPLVAASRWLAIPVALALFAITGAQAYFGFLPWSHDPTARLLGVGWQDLAGKIENVRLLVGARCIIVDNYGLASWLAFYLPQTPVVQFNEPERWVNLPEPPATLFTDKVLYVGDASADAYASKKLPAIYADLELQGELLRRRGDRVLDAYRLTLLKGLRGDPFDRTPEGQR